MSEAINIAKPIIGGIIKRGVKRGRAFIRKSGSSHINRYKAGDKRSAKVGLIKGPGGFMEKKSVDWWFDNSSGWGVNQLSAITGTDSYMTAAGTGGMVCLTSYIKQGTSFTDRIGNKIRIKSVRVEGTLQAEGTSKTNMARVMLIYDAQPNGAYPAITDIFNSSSNSTTATKFYSGINMNNKSRFIVLKNAFYPLDEFGNGINKKINFMVKKPMDVMYKGNNGTIADVATGALYLITVSEDFLGEGGASGCVAYYNLHVRIRFHD